MPRLQIAESPLQNVRDGCGLVPVAAVTARKCAIGPGKGTDLFSGLSVQGSLKRIPLLEGMFPEQNVDFFIIEL
jgi:hypothetical protein